MEEGAGRRVEKKIGKEKRKMKKLLEDRSLTDDHLGLVLRSVVSERGWKVAEEEKSVLILSEGEEEKSVLILTMAKNKLNCECFASQHALEVTLLQNLSN